MKGITTLAGIRIKLSLPKVILLFIALGLADLIAFKIRFNQMSIAWEAAKGPGAIPPFSQLVNFEAFSLIFVAAVILLTFILEKTLSPGKKSGEIYTIKRLGAGEKAIFAAESLIAGAYALLLILVQIFIILGLFRIYLTKLPESAITDQLLFLSFANPANSFLHSLLPAGKPLLFFRNILMFIFIGMTLASENLLKYRGLKNSTAIIAAAPLLYASISGVFSTDAGAIIISGFMIGIIIYYIYKLVESEDECNAR